MKTIEQIARETGTRRTLKMNTRFLRFITKHVRGKPCTRSQVLITHDRIIAFACLIGTIASLAAIAVLLVIITQLVFGGFNQ